VNNEDQPLDQDENVVVIEERDSKNILYIATAAILGLAMGGLIGSYATNSKWQSAYISLESKIESIKSEKEQIVTEKVIQIEQKQENIDQLIEQRVSEQIDVMTEDFQQKLAQSGAMVTELEKLNIELEERVQAQQKQIDEQIGQLSSLNRQSDLQTAVLERSRELFQREFSIKQQLAKLQEEREALAPKLETYKKQCDIYLEGKSWDASSKSCDQQDAVNSELSQIDQMIEVHKLDLREIKQISEQMGL